MAVCVGTFIRGVNSADTNGIAALSLIGGIIGLTCGWAISHVQRQQQPAIDVLKQKESVVYFCGLPYMQGLLLISANHIEDTLSIWTIHRKKPVLFAVFRLPDITLRKTYVRIAMLRKVEGLSMEVPKETDKSLRIALYGDMVTPFMKPLRGDTLDQAIRRLGGR